MSSTSLNRKLIDALINAVKSLTEAEQREFFQAFEKEQNPTTPMMNDAHRTNLDEIPRHKLSSSDATAFAVRLERLYRRAGNGGYDWKAANRAAWHFLAKHSADDRERVARFVDEHHSSLAGKLPVYPGMFEELWNFMIQKGG